jgi:hypothetical protein
MRRYVQIFGLMVLALGAGGWGAVVAVTLCPHARLAVAAGNVTEDQACHQAKPEPVAQPHCHDSGMAQEATGEMPAPRVLTDNSGRSAALVSTDEVACAHCIGRSELPASTLVVRQRPEPKRSLELAAPQSTSLTTPTVSFTQPVSYRQGAPPGRLTPKHLLMGVLLI